MIDLYTAATPNGQKVHIMLAECGLPYNEHWIDLDKGEQFDPAFLAISPNNKIPALVDSEGPDGKPVTVFESGAILLYLAEKTGRFLPADPRERLEVLQWLFWQMGGFGPMLGQAHHFRAYARERIPYAIDRYTNEARRLYQILDHRLGEAPYVGGAYSIADMAIFPWCRLHGRQSQHLAQHVLLRLGEVRHVHAALGTAQRRAQRHEQDLQEILLPCIARSWILDTRKTRRKPFHPRLLHEGDSNRIHQLNRLNRRNTSLCDSPGAYLAEAWTKELHGIRFRPG